MYFPSRLILYTCKLAILYILRVTDYNLLMYFPSRLILYTCKLAILYILRVTDYNLFLPLKIAFVLSNSTIPDKMMHYAVAFRSSVFDKVPLRSLV